MAFANGSQTRLAYVAEATFGVTPATPSFKTLRATSSTLRTNKTTVTSEEIRADRNLSDEILVGYGASGEIAGELSYGSWDDLFGAAFFGAWSGDVLKNGVTASYLTVEETLELGATDSFSRFSGMMVDRLSLSIVARQVITLRASLMGQKETLAEAIVTGATYAAANSNPIQAAPAGVAALDVGGIAAKVRSVTLDIANNLRERPVIDSLYTEEMGSGRCDVSGSIEAYFQSNALYQAALDHDSGALTMTLGSEAGEKYTLLLPRIVFGDAQRGERNNNSDVMVTIPFRATFDETEACQIKLTRAVA